MSVYFPKTVQLACLFVWLAAACSGPSGEESKPKLENTSKAHEEDKVDEKIEKMVFEGPGEMLPPSVDDFEIASPPRYFGPGNLYDLINGGAEIYVEFGLTKMVTADFKSKSHENLTVTVEIYDQGSMLGAFGRMARFLAGRNDLSGISDGLPENLKEKGRFGGTDLVYYKGKYLVHVTMLDESPKATVESMTKASKEILPGFATAVANKIKADPALPPIYNAFPKANRVERSWAYDAARLAGLKDLGSGYSYRYIDGEASWSLYVTDELADPGAIHPKIADESGRGKSKFTVAGKRIVGYQTFDESWTPEQQKNAEKQMVELGEAAGK